MSNKKKDIAFGFVMLFIVSIFIFGMLKWPEYKQSHIPIAKNLYYVTVSFVMYTFSFLVLLLAQRFWFKVGASIALSVFAINLYVELFLDPQHWSNWDMWLIVVVAGNLLVTNIIIEKIKSK